MFLEFCIITGISQENLFVKRGHNLDIEKRQLLFKYLRVNGLTYTKIKELFNYKSHSSIILGIKHIENIIDIDKETALLWDEINKIQFKNIFN